MLRSGAPRAALRALQPSTTPAARLAFNGSTVRAQWSSRLCTLAIRRPQAFAIPASTATLSLVRYQSDAKNVADKVLEEKLRKEQIPSDPSMVSTTSSVHPIMSEVGKADTEKEVDMMAGVKSDIQTIKDTFSLTDVPRQAYVVGLAGVVPYLATSLSTVFCAWEINNNVLEGSGFLMSGKSAELLLQIIEPLQVGYGAVILSFLGAIHWGLEWAKYGGEQGYKRYAIGIVAPAIAWPTIMLSPIYALTTQFLAFTYLYYADSRAARRGWAPAWYSTYRFVLTFIVGASIVISLIGKGQIVGHVEKLPNPIDRIRAFRDNAAEELAANEAAHRDESIEESKKIKEEAE